MSGIFDQEDEDEPWFISRAEDEAEDRPAEPADASWAEAEGALAAKIAHCARLLGRLEALADVGAPFARLHAQEVADALWRAGAPVRGEFVALALAQAGSAGGRAADIDWARRRLEAPLESATVEGLRFWLGRGGREAEEKARDFLPAQGAEFDAALARIAALHPQMAGRSPFAAAAAQGFALARDPAFGEWREVTAFLLIARLAAGAQSALPFAPFALGARRLRFVGGSPRADLEMMLDALSESAEAALLDFGRLRDWREKAGALADDLQGRSGRLALPVIYSHLAVNAGMVSKLAGISRASAERVLMKFESEGLMREITGGERWRWWMANV